MVARKEAKNSILGGSLKTPSQAIQLPQILCPSPIVPRIKSEKGLNR
jgi:hypothetical protein